MPSITVYLDEDRYRFLLKKGERASAVAKKMLEEKIDEDRGKG